MSDLEKREADERLTCTVHRGAWAANCPACEAMRQAVVTRKGSWSLGDSGEIDAAEHWLGDIVRHQAEALSEAEAHINALRPLLLWEFGTTDPELIAGILNDRKADVGVSHG